MYKTTALPPTGHHTDCSLLPLRISLPKIYYSFKKLKSLNILYTQDFGSDVKVQLYAPPTGNIDGNLVVLWILAIGTVTIGAYWCGITTKKKM